MYIYFFFSWNKRIKISFIFNFYFILQCTFFVINIYIRKYVIFKILTINFGWRSFRLYLHFYSSKPHRDLARVLCGVFQAVSASLEQRLYVSTLAWIHCGRVSQGTPSTGEGRANLLLEILLLLYYS